MKKKILIPIALICATLQVRANADTLFYKAFKVDFGGGFTSNSQSNGTDGMLSIEPHYSLNNYIAIGLRYQPASVINSNTPVTNGNYNFRVNYVSFCATADYYFTKPQAKSNFRLFAGAGTGVFTQTVVKNTITNPGTIVVVNSDVTKSTGFGFFPRVGVEAWHLRAWVDYNLTGGSYQYYSINLGFFFGGGKKQF